MAFFLRLLLMLSILAILFGVLIKINHWNYSGYIFMNGGIAGLVIYIVGTFIIVELNKMKERK